MPTTQRFALPAIALLCAWALGTTGSTAGEAVTAHLSDGRAVTGTVDVRTDANYLWLRRSAEQFDLVSGYPWGQVLEGHVEGQTLDTSELKQWVSARKQVGRKFAELTPLPDFDVEVLSVPQLPDSLPAVKTLVIDAELAQWDNDAQTDGLRIFVAPLDASGHLVPIDGHIEFTLVVEREYANRGRRYTKGPEFVPGDRLTFPVKKEHFSSGAAFYELPFSRWHPDFEPTLADQALLHARLSVPGQGVFEASDAQVCLRQLSRFRDSLQYYSPRRYLPLENPSRDGR